MSDTKGRGKGSAVPVAPAKSDAKQPLARQPSASATPKDAKGDAGKPAAEGKAEAEALNAEWLELKTARGAPYFVSRITGELSVIRPSYLKQKRTATTSDDAAVHCTAPNAHSHASPTDANPLVPSSLICLCAVLLCACRLG